MQRNTEIAYDDFEIEIGHGKGLDYPIAVLHSDAGETRETMHFPYDELVLENRLLALKTALLGSGGDRRTFLSPEEQTVQNFGSDLFNALITGEVRNRYDISLEKAKQKGRGLRVKLHIQSPNLAVLPWEFLYETRQEEYMGLMRSISIVRYPELPQPIQPLTVELPLRILGMVSSPKDLHPLDIDNEKQRVEEALKNLKENGLVELTWLPGQTWRDLQKAMLGGPWHIFHFIGHGGFDPVRKEGIIALADDVGRMRPFCATELSRLLADHQSLRLVILNSCEGARGSERDLNSSTASILVRRGIPAVLAMQYKITDRAAIEFSRTFYDTLAYGLPVDTAVAEARKAISIEIANTVEWGTPVLYMRSPDGMLFNVQKKKTKGKKRIKEELIASEKEEPLEEKNRDIELKEKEAKEAEQLEQERREQEGRQTELSALYSKGMDALATQDWKTAIKHFNELLSLDAGYTDAGTKLKEAEERKEREEQELIAGEKEDLKAGERKEYLPYKKVLIVFGILGILFVGYLIYHTQTTGSISVDSIPSNASIYLDGSYQGTTPMTIKSVKADSYTITLRLTGYQDWSQTIRIVAGEIAYVSPPPLTPIPLQQTTGSISVSSSPSGASIYLDSSYQGTTPMTIKSVRADSYTITLRLTGYQDWSQTIRIVAGEIAYILPTLSPKLPDLPDLFITEHSFYPINPTCCDPVSVRIAIKNKGNIKSKAFSVQWWANENDAMPAKTWQVESLDTQEEKILTYTYDRYTIYGNFITKVIVDSSTEIIESNEEDNQDKKPISIKFYYPSNEPIWGGGWTNIVPSNHMGQSFFLKGSYLSAVEVGIITGNPGSGGDSITMRILSEDKRTLFNKSQFVSEGFNGWLRFDMPNGALNVAPCSNLTIELEDTGKVMFGWKYGSNTYPDGSAIVFGSYASDRDNFFRVNP